jgi:cytochrome c-type biogenesis protein CcmH/NrfF
MQRYFKSVFIPVTPRDGVRAGLASLVLASGFCVVLARYWHFYHLSTPGTDTGLLLFVLPMSLVSAMVVSLALTVVLRARHVSPRLASWSGPALVAVIFAALIAAEIARTSAARSGEGERVGDLAPFLHSLVPLR